MGSITPLEFFGGATNITINSNTPLNTTYRFWRVTNTGLSTVKVTFPSTASIGLLIGSPIFILANVGSTAFEYRDLEGVLPSGLSLTTNRGIIVSMYLIECTPQWAIHSQPFAFAYSSY